MINLLTSTIIILYQMWIIRKTWFFFKLELKIESANDLFFLTLQRKRFYFTQIVLGICALVVFSFIKPAQMIMGHYKETGFSIFIFGRSEITTIPDALGAGGMILLVSIFICWKRLVKARHYIQIMYAFKEQLNVEVLQSKTNGTS